MTPSSTRSSRPPVALATTGLPCAIASARRHPVALAKRRDAHDRRALVEAADLRARDEAERVRDLRTERAVADDHARQPLRRRGELERALLRREPPDEEDVRRLLRLDHLLGQRDGARDHAHVTRAELPRGLRQRGRRTDHEPRAPQHRPKHRGRAARELDIRAPELHHERLSRRERRQPRGQPVRVDEVGAVGGPPRRARVRAEERRQQRQLPRRPAQVAGDAVPVRDPEVPERGRRDDVDLDPRLAQPRHAGGDEGPGRIPLPPRVRGREHDDLHAATSRRPNTIGAASTSSASAKK